MTHRRQARLEHALHADARLLPLCTPAFDPELESQSAPTVPAAANRAVPASVVVVRGGRTWVLGEPARQAGR